MAMPPLLTSFSEIHQFDWMIEFHFFFFFFFFLILNFALRFYDHSMNPFFGSRICFVCLCFSYSFILCFELTANHTVVLKAENMAEKLEWMSKLRSCIEPTTKGASIRSGSTPEFDSSRRFNPLEIPMVCSLT